MSVTQLNGRQIADNTTPLSKLSQLSANTIVGNNTAGTANAAALTSDQVVDLLGLPGLDFAARLNYNNLYPFS